MVPPTTNRLQSTLGGFLSSGLTLALDAQLVVGLALQPVDSVEKIYLTIEIS